MHVLIPFLVFQGFLLGLWLGEPWLFILGLILANQLNYLWKPLSINEIKTEFSRLKQSAFMKYFMGFFLFALVSFYPWVLQNLINLSGISLSLGVLASIIVYATFIVSIGHEFIHKRNPFFQFFGHFCLSLFGLPGFLSNHIYEHHARFGTKDDPSVSNLNESFYRFLLRIIPHRISFLIHPKTKFKIYRRLLFYNFLGCFFYGLGLCLTAVVFNSPKALFIHLSITFFQYLFFEATNYIQHYGLIDPSNKKPGINHAWNHYGRYTNFLTFMLPIHSAHHLRANESLDQRGPSLPYAYFLMLLLSLFPKLWFKLMNPKVDLVKSTRT